MRRWLMGLATTGWLLLAACGGGQNAQTQEPQTARGISDTTQLPSGARAAAGAEQARPQGVVRDVVTQGETAYALTSDGLVLLDLRTPAEPKVVATVLLGSGARRVAVGPNRAYVACGDNGLKIVDLSKPRTPLILGTYAPDAGGVELVAAEGDLLLVGLGARGVALVDVSEPSAPSERKRLSNLKTARDLALAGRWGYVLGDKLTVLDLSKPTEARVAATFDPKDKALAMALVGQRALLASTKQCLLLDVASPEKPVRLAALSWADARKQFPPAKADGDEAKPAPAEPAPPRAGSRPEPAAKQPSLRVSAAGQLAGVTFDGRAYRLGIEDRALNVLGVLDDLGAVSVVTVADGLVAATVAGELVILALDGKAASTVGRLSLLPARGAESRPATGAAPPNPPTREGQAALDAVPEPRPAMPSPTPPSAD